MRVLILSAIVIAMVIFIASRSGIVGLVVLVVILVVAMLTYVFCEYWPFRIAYCR